MMAVTTLPNPTQTIFEIDGYEITASFSEEEKPEVIQRVKQILLAASELKSDIDAA